MQLDRLERIDKLDETVGGLQGDYERLIRAMQGREKEDGKEEGAEEGSAGANGGGGVVEAGERRERAKRKVVVEDDDDEEEVSLAKRPKV